MAALGRFSVDGEPLDKSRLEEFLKIPGIVVVGSGRMYGKKLLTLEGVKGLIHRNCEIGGCSH